MRNLIEIFRQKRQAEIRERSEAEKRRKERILLERQETQQEINRTRELRKRTVDNLKKVGARELFDLFNKELLGGRGSFAWGNEYGGSGAPLNFQSGFLFGSGRGLHPLPSESEWKAILDRFVTEDISIRQIIHTGGVTAFSHLFNPVVRNYKLGEEFGIDIAWDLKETPYGTFLGEGNRIKIIASSESIDVWAGKIEFFSEIKPRGFVGKVELTSNEKNLREQLGELLIKAYEYSFFCPDSERWEISVGSM